MSITFAQPEVYTLLVVSPFKVLSALASSFFLAPSSAVLPKAASPSDFVKPTLSRAVRMCPTFTDATSPSRSLLQSLCDRLPQRGAEFAMLDDKYSQR